MQILRRPEVEGKTGLARSTLYAAIAAGKFPAPIRLGARSVGWLADEVDGWLAERIAASRAA